MSEPYGTYNTRVWPLCHRDNAGIICLHLLETASASSAAGLLLTSPRLDPPVVGLYILLCWISPIQQPHK